MVQLLNPLSGLNHWVSPLDIKKAVVGTAGVASVALLAKAVFERDSIQATAAVIFGAVTFIAWTDLGASEQNATYKASFVKEVKREKEEGETIDKLRSQLKETKDDVTRIQTSLGEAQAKNTKLQQLIDQLTNNFETLTKEKNEALEASTKLQKEIETLGESLGELKERVQEKLQEIEKLTQELQVANEQREGLLRIITDLEQQLAAAKKTNNAFHK